MKRTEQGKYISRDITIVVLSFVVAILLFFLGVFDRLIAITQSFTVMGSFVAGFFFTSVFTIAPASIALAKLAEFQPPVVIAFYGCLGATLCDFLIFLYIRDSVTDDIRYVARRLKLKRFLSHFHFGILKIVAPIVGALIIASPLPDELGIALMGISRTKTAVLIPVALVMNFIGILAIVSVAHIF
jgi:hypothetical protein